MIFSIWNFLRASCFEFRISQTGFIKLTKRALATYLIFFIAFSSITGLFLFNPWTTKTTEAAWFNDDWSYRKSVAVSSNTGEDSNSYVSMTITNTDTMVTNGQLQSDCGDLRFTKTNGDILPYYISSGCNSASTVIHVLFDTLPAGASTFYYYYGNSTVINGFESAAFSTEAVSYVIGSQGSEEKNSTALSYWKFDDSQGTTTQDSSTGNNDMTLTGTAPAWAPEDKCISGMCLYYPGVTSGNGSTVATTTLTPYSQLTTGTISFWAKVTAQNSQQAMFFLGRTTDTNNSSLQVYYDNRTSGGSNFQVTLRQDSTIYWDFTVSSSQFNSINETNRWHYYTLVHNGTTPSLYIDGNPMTLSFSTSTDQTKWLKAIITDATNDANAIRVMQAYVNSTVFYAATGFFDELKIYSQNRTAAQIKADYTARSNPNGIAVQLGNSNRNNPGTLSDGLVGHWRMDATTANTCVGGVNDACDYSGNLNDGAWNGNATLSSTSKIGYATTFDGNGDYINVADSASLTPGNSSWSVSIWANPANSDQTSPIITKRQDGTPYEMWAIYICGDVQCDTSGQKMTVLYQENATGNYFRHSTDNDIADGNWHMYAFVADKNALTVRLYVDGVLQTATESNSGTWPTIDNTDPVRLANDNGTTYYTGNLDEARVYNRALSSGEITQLYNWGPGPVGYWKLDEGSWTNNCSTDTVFDSSGNGLNGDACPNSTGPTGGAQGKFNKAGRFDGNDYVSMGNPTTLHIQRLTYSAWIKRGTASSGNYGIFAHASASGVSGGPVFYINTSHRLELAKAGTGVCTGSSTITDTTSWHHVAISYDLSNCYFYIDGRLDSSPAFSQTFNYSGNNAHIGSHTTSGTFFNGLIDDVKVYNYPRTASQVIEDMNGGHPGPGSPVATAIGHWRFDEGADNMCSGGTNDVCNNGSAGNTYDGTSTADRTNAGKFNRALDFNGTDDAVTITNATAIDLNEGLSTFTFSAWIQADSDGEGDVGEIFAKGTNTFLRTDSQSGSDLDIECSLDRATTDTTVNVSTAITISSWNYVACSWDGTTLKVYINGVERGSSSSGSGAIAADTNNLRIGGTNAFEGRIDEFKAYNFALTADQIKLDMNRGASQTLGAVSTSSDSQPMSAASEYCPPDSSTAICTGPIAEWKFNEKTGTSTNDTSGNARTGTITAATWTNGKFDGGLRFDGSGDYVTVGDVIEPTNITLSAWVKANSVATNQRIISKWGTLGTQTQYLLSTDDSNSNRFTFAVTNNGTSYDVCDSSASGTYAVNTWVYVAATYNGTTCKIYVNGLDVTTVALDAASGNIQNTTTSLRLGIEGIDGSSNPFNGTLDQIRIYDYARSASQIAWEYNKGGPIAWYKMDDCQGTTIRDSSGNSLSGTLTVGAGGGEDTVGTCQTSSTAWGNGAAGKKNYSIDLDGTDDSISVSDNSALDLTTTGTLAAWIYRDSTGSWHGIIHKGNDNTCTNGYCLDIQDDNRVLAVVGNGSNETLLNSLATISSGQWYHLAFTWDGTDTKIYINGRLDNQTSQTYSASANANSLHIGELGNADYFNGQIDDARIYNYGLTATQIKTLYNEGAARFGPSTGAP